MDKFSVVQLTREQVDQWAVATSGLSARVVHCLDLAGVKTIGELRKWREKELLALSCFGATSMRNVRWFFNWTKRLEKGIDQMSSFPSLLREFLTNQEVFVLEQRYGLTDPLFRPQMKRRTLREIGNMRAGITRERVRQVEDAAISAMQSSLCRAAVAVHEAYWVNRIHDCGGVVTSAELKEWVSDPMLVNYQPWGVLLLLSEISNRIYFRYDYFSALPAQVLSQVEKQILQLLGASRSPVPFEAILASVSDELHFPNGQRPRFVTVLMDHHPQISGTIDRRYFLPSVGAPLVLADILRNLPEPIHFHELTRLYNDRMLPHSRKGPGYILRMLNLMPAAQRVSRALYRLNPH